MGNFANATMPCCMMGSDNIKAQTQIDDGILDSEDCHKTEKSDQQDAQDCSGCDCQHCVKIVELSTNTPPYIKIMPSAISFLTESIYSHQPDGVFQPPKNIS